MSNQNLDVNQSPSSITQGGNFSSKKPYIILFGIIILFLIGLLYAMAQRGNIKNNNEKDSQNSIKSDTTKIDKLLKSLSSTKHQYSEKNSTTPKILTIPKTETLPPLQSPQKPKMSDSEKERLAIRKIKHKALLDAITSKTKISNSDILKPIKQTLSKDVDISNAPNTDFLNKYIKNYDKINHKADNSNSPKAKDILSQENSNEYLQYTKQKPISPYELKRGSLIPAVLIGGINSELSGNIIAQVRESVYDTVTGNHLLIPQGSKLIGVYSPLVQYGQTRVLIAL